MTGIDDATGLGSGSVGGAIATGSALPDFRSWRAQIVARSAFTCEPIPFADSTGWRFEDGILRHRTGGFFSLAGLRVTAREAPLDGQEQLIILQPETAINGFLVRRRDGAGEVLFQGRVEPGNTEVLQLAPTVQSTEANYKRMHGGGATAFIEWFVTESGAPAPTLYDELQSEEATRYYGKYNRNVVCDAGDADPELPSTFRWYGLEALAEFAVTSNVLNTDARSVLSGLDCRKPRSRTRSRTSPSVTTQLRSAVSGTPCAGRATARRGPALPAQGEP